jgi:cytochrome c-type biogenesis protein CcmH/NrfF
MSFTLSSRPEREAHPAEICAPSQPPGFRADWTSAVPSRMNGMEPVSTAKAKTWALRPGPCALKRTIQSLAIVLTLALTAAADNTNVAQSTRFDKLGHRMMCTCSCAQVLLECNHVGCPNSEGMRQELMAGVSNGDSDNTIFQSFVQKYGPTVLAAPPGTGFNIVGWVMPFAVLIVGIGGTSLLIRRWRLHAIPMPAQPTTPTFTTIRDRIRRDTDF